MTSLTKRYFELSDLASVVISCSHCGSSLTLPLASDGMRFPSDCPACGVMWSEPVLPLGLVSSRTTKAEYLDTLAKALYRLKMCLRSDSLFSLHIETAETDVKSSNEDASR
jgi:hypothetical protein